MKKLLLVMLVPLMVVTLTGCTEDEDVQCSGDLELKDGVCVEKDDPVNNEQGNTETSLCEVDFDSYNATEYELTWDDEFDYEGTLDSTKWEYMIGNGGAYGIPGWGNGESQYYSNELKNVEVKDGLLRITASTDGYAQYTHTSGRVRTANLGDFKYGVIEVCAKMPDTLGTWPAIWMLPTNSPYGGWPTGGEIDIMEAVGFETDTVHFNIHTQHDNWGTSQSIGSHSSIDNIASEYHAYAIKWVEGSIVFYVDGQVQFSYVPAQDTYEYWPFDTEFHLLLNIAVGGSWGGQQGIQSGNWEDSMYVDYVRVYQEK